MRFKFTRLRPSHGSLRRRARGRRVIFFGRATAPASTWPTRGSCSRRSSGCIRAFDLGSGSRSSRASSATAEGLLGRRRGRQGARIHFTLGPTTTGAVSAGGCLMESTGAILLVEDDPDDEALTLRALANNIANEIFVARDRPSRRSTISATGPHEGRDRSQLPQVVLLDLKLPPGWARSAAPDPRRAGDEAPSGRGAEPAWRTRPRRVLRLGADSANPSTSWRSSKRRASWGSTG